MDEILLQALVSRVKSGDMAIEQVPIPFQAEVNRLLSPPIEE